MGFWGFMVRAAARCFDQASFEVMGQRAELPPRGSDSAAGQLRESAAGSDYC